MRFSKLTFVFILGVSLAASAGAQDHRDHQDIHHAIGIYIPPKGQKYFRDNFGALLEANMGQELATKEFGRWEYKATEPLRLDQLGPKFDRYYETLAKLRDTLKTYLPNLALNDPKVHVTVGDAGYDARFSRLGLRFDANPAAPSRSVFATLEVETPALRLHAEDIQAVDQANDFLEFGVKRVEASLATKSKPLRFEVPFLVELQNHMLKISPKVDKPNNNITAVTFNSSFARPLEIPVIELRVGKRVSRVDQTVIEESLLSQKDEGVKAIQGYFKEYVQTKAPAVVSQMVESVLPPLEFSNSMNPPAAPDSIKDKHGAIRDEDKLTYGLAPGEISLDASALYIGLTGFLEDPKAAASVALPSASVAGTREPTFSHYPAGTYDAAIAIDEVFINRLMQLSGNRDYFAKLNIGPRLKITNHPYFKLDHTVTTTPTGGLIRLPVAIEYTQTDVNSWMGTAERAILTKDKLKVEVDLVTELKRTPDGGVKLIKKQVDVNSLRVESDGVLKIWGLGWTGMNGWIYNKLRGFIVGELNKLNQQWQRKEEALGELKGEDLPQSVFGIPIKIKGVHPENTGNFLLYVEFGE